MKIYKKVLLGLAVMSSASVGFGANDYYCEGSAGMELTGLACISCGIQKYQNEIRSPAVPSEKWLALLAVNVRAFRDLNPNGKDDIVRSEMAKQNMQKVIIAQVQAYGFCTNYPGSASEFFPYITQPDDLKTDKLDEVAKKFGFRSDPSYYRNMRNLMDDVDYNQASLSDKRLAFRDRASVSRIKNEPEDMGLRRCLNESYGRVNPAPPEGDSYRICQAMAESCGINAGFCSEPIPRWNRGNSVVNQQNLPNLPNTTVISQPPTNLGPPPTRLGVQ